MIPGGRKLELVAVGGCARTLAERAHPNPFDRQRVNETTKMHILPPWRPRNPSLPAA
jgi:hypothetical protein